MVVGRDLPRMGREPAMFLAQWLFSPTLPYIAPTPPALPPSRRWPCPHHCTHRQDLTGLNIAFLLPNDWTLCLQDGRLLPSYAYHWPPTTLPPCLHTYHPRAAEPATGQIRMTTCRTPPGWIYFDPWT